MKVGERSKNGCPIPKYPAGSWIEKLKKEKIILTDIINKNAHFGIDIFIGGVHCESFRNSKRIQGDDHLYAVKTIFDVMLCGPLPREDGAAIDVNFVCGEIKKLWNLELLGINDSAEHETKLEHDESVKTQFQQQINQKEDDCSRVRFPFKHEKSTVVNTCEVAKKRLFSTTKKKCQKFLWWNEGKMDCVGCRFTRVVFGMTCSLFILATIESGTFKFVSTALMTEARIILRQWESNCEKEPEQAERGVLWVLWNEIEDTLSVNKPKIDLHSDGDVTNGKALSLIDQVFDPVGVVCPSILLPKLMLQRNVEKKVKWDEPWTLEEVKEFLKRYAEEEKLMEIKIPRFAYRMNPNEADRKKIHLFCDAGITTNGCCAFIRTENSEMDVDVQLLMAKSRVASLRKKNKNITIPRLELLACLIGKRLLSTNEGAMEEETPVHLWSDSSTCIAWITREELWGGFVQNRVREMMNLTNMKDWRHIPGSLNPADLPSRGCSPPELVESKWWEGPSWLKMPQINQPSSPLIVDEEEVMMEKRKPEMTCLAIDRVEPRFSHYMKNVRVAAWARRFAENCKVKLSERKLGKFLSVHELRRGEQDLIMEIQSLHFPEKPDVKGFNVEKYDDGLWHLKTRLTNRERWNVSHVMGELFVNLSVMDSGLVLRY